METFPKAVRCQRCRANFYDFTGRCPECAAFTDRGRRAMIWKVVILVVSAGLIAVAIDLVAIEKDRRAEVSDEVRE